MLNPADFNELNESEKRHFDKCERCGEMVDMRQLDDVLFHEDQCPQAGHSIRRLGTARRIKALKGLRLLTLEEKNAMAVLADAVDRCRKEDMRTPEVLASLDLLARRTSIRWPFEQFKESLNFAVGDPSHAEGRWQNVHASLNAIRRAVGVR